MTYRSRSNSVRSKAWRSWIAENRRHLERIRLPLAVYQDADHWDDFLEMGSLDRFFDGPPFEFGDLTRGAQEQLCAFLERHYPDRPPALLGWLRVRLGKA